MAKNISVLHLDDQPEHASSIPREISNWFWKWFGEDMRRTAHMEENDEETEFKLNLIVGDDDFDLHYRIYTDVDLFYAALTDASKGDSSVAMVILDQTFNDNAHVGGNAYRYIETNVPTMLDQTIILTAYPSLTCSQLQWSENDKRLVSKPPAPIKIIAQFLHGFLPSASPGIRLRLNRALEEEELI